MGQRMGCIDLQPRRCDLVRHIDSIRLLFLGLGEVIGVPAPSLGVLSSWVVLCLPPVESTQTMLPMRVPVRASPWGIRSRCITRPMPYAPHPCGLQRGTGAWDRPSKMGRCGHMLPARCYQAGTSEWKWTADRWKILKGIRRANHKILGVVYLILRF